MSKTFAARGGQALNILRVDSSARGEDSTTRSLADRLVEAIARHGPVSVTRRDAARGIPLVDAGFVDATFTPADGRNDCQRAALATSDALVAELAAADVLVLGLPVYNFGPPAALKAWIDMVARAGVTFRYTERGPQGLLGGIRAFVVVASGGVEVDGAADFATPWLRQVLSFLGIDDVVVIHADRQNIVGEQALAEAVADIESLALSPADLRRAA